MHVKSKAHIFELGGIMWKRSEIYVFNLVDTSACSSLSLVVSYWMWTLHSTSCEEMANGMHTLSFMLHCEEEKVHFYYGKMGYFQFFILTTAPQCHMNANTCDYIACILHNTCNLFTSERNEHVAFAGWSDGNAVWQKAKSLEDKIPSKHYFVVCI